MNKTIDRDKAKELIKILEPTIEEQNETIKNIYSKLIIKINN